jgi:hypothetical protein
LNPSGNQNLSLKLKFFVRRRGKSRQGRGKEKKRKEKINHRITYFLNTKVMLGSYVWAKLELGSEEQKNMDLTVTK